MKQSTWIFSAVAVLFLALNVYKYTGPAASQQAAQPSAPTDLSSQPETITPEPDANLVIWTDHDTLAFMQEAARLFNEEHGYGIRFAFTEVAPLDSVTRLIQDGGTARVADVLEIEHDTLGRAIVAGALMENLVSAERVRREFIPPAVHAATYDNKVYGFPVSFATVALFYNQDILPQPPQTFEELIELAKRFNDNAKNRYALLWNVQNYYFSRMFLTLFGGYEFGNFGADAKDLGIASDQAVEGLNAMLGLKVANSARNADMVNPQVPRGLFAEGKVAALIEGPWAAKALTSSNVRVGVVPMPTLKGRHPRTFSTVRLAVVSANSPYPRAAQLFADYLASAKMVEKRYEMAGTIPPMQSVSDRIAPQASPAIQAILQQARYSDAMPSIPEMGYLWSPMAGAMVDLWDNGKPAREVLTAAKDIIEEQLKLQEEEDKK